MEEALHNNFARTMFVSDIVTKISAAALAKTFWKGGTDVRNISKFLSASADLVASMLPVYHQHVASLLLACCKQAASMLPVCC